MQPSLEIATLEARARWELETLDYPRRPWLKPLPGDARPVVIIGAGQAGLAIGFALARARVPVLLLDDLPEGASAVWKGFGRMATLRTPKHVLGPELGVPALSARAWYTARFGAAAWEAMAKIPRGDWQDYLDWLAGMAADASPFCREPAAAAGEFFPLRRASGFLPAHRLPGDRRRHGGRCGAVGHARWSGRDRPRHPRHRACG